MSKVLFGNRDMVTIRHPQPAGGAEAAWKTAACFFRDPRRKSIPNWPGKHVRHFRTKTFSQVPPTHLHCFRPPLVVLYSVFPTTSPPDSQPFPCCGLLRFLGCQLIHWDWNRYWKQVESMETAGILERLWQGPRHWMGRSGWFRTSSHSTARKFEN